ncbi:MULTISPECIES: PQQ-binding-like beta-propeller repeat protein [Streptomyces]|uniref:outer membrane protein assembly factor BamB family protein n=1 Tax=Streptomyces TaxID=1883 RepID=UPI0012E229B3|nr:MULTISPECIES: PQQ-binding-like beta-propeller repeat protein [Streptomyces]
MTRYGAGAPGPVSRTHWDVRRLNEPNALWGSNGVAFGPDGRLYTAQFLAGKISAVDPSTGEVETVVPMDGPVQSPDDLAFGADGSMYITDLVPGRVWRRGPRGDYTLVSDQVQVPNGITCVGDRLFVNEMKMDGRLLELFPGSGDEPRTLAGGLALGNAMQLGPDGRLYYPHMVTGQVWCVPLDGGEPEPVAENVHEPVAVRFDRGGVMLVLSRGRAGLVTRIDLHGTGSRSVIASGLAGLDNAAFDDANRMFVSSFASGGITELHPDGRTRDIVPRGLGGPYGVTVDPGGTVYAADHYRVAGPAPAPAGGTDAVTTHVLRPFAHGISARDGLLHITSQYGEISTYDPESGSTRVRATGLRRPTGIAARPDGGLIVAETGAGRVLALAEDDTVTTLAAGLRRPVDVALDAEGRCYVSDEQDGAVLRIEDGRAVTVADGLDAPQGLAVLGDEVFVVETGSRKLRAVSLTTGRHRTDAEDLPVGLPPDTAPRTRPALFTHGMPGVPDPFAGLTAAPDGSLLLSANGEGTVLRLVPRRSAGTPGTDPADRAPGEAPSPDGRAG